MAKRRKIAAPSQDDLNRIEDEFRRETKAGPAMPPIAQVAADTAGQMAIETAARSQADGQALQHAKENGLLISEIPLDDIEAEVIVRDRTVMYEADLLELKNSIAKNGLRLPIEIFKHDRDRPYGLLSGYRRLRAYQDLFELTGDEKYKKIKTIIRDPDALGGAFSAMVEENEVRSSLSHFERGRIAVIATQQGAYPSTEDAVGALFSSASKAKRSKVRSFAVIFEELGDMLQFPESLKERDGLRVSAALRNGAEARFREVLSAGQGTTAELEWDLLEQVAEEYEAKAVPGKKGGRPKTKAPKVGWANDDVLRLSSGVVLQRQSDSQGYLIRVKGKGVDEALISRAMEHLQYLFEKPE